MGFSGYERMRSTVIVTLLAVAALALGGCASMQGPVQVPELRLASLTLVDASVDAQRFRVGLAVHNPNPIPIPVEQVSFSVRLGGSGIMSGRSLAPFLLAANGSETLELDVESDLVSSLSRLLALLQGPNDALSYDLDGLVTLSRGLQRTLPFSYRGRVPLSMPAQSR